MFGGGSCSLCKSLHTSKINCPLNPFAINPSFSKHPLAKNIMEEQEKQLDKILVDKQPENIIKSTKIKTSAKRSTGPYQNYTHTNKMPIYFGKLPSFIFSDESINLEFKTPSVNPGFALRFNLDDLLQRIKKNQNKEVELQNFIKSNMQQLDDKFIDNVLPYMIDLYFVKYGICFFNSGSDNDSDDDTYQLILGVSDNGYPFGIPIKVINNNYTSIYKKINDHIKKLYDQFEAHIGYIKKSEYIVGANINTEYDLKFKKLLNHIKNLYLNNIQIELIEIPLYWNILSPEILVDQKINNAYKYYKSILIQNDRYDKAKEAFYNTLHRANLMKDCKRLLKNKTFKELLNTRLITELDTNKEMYITLDTALRTMSYQDFRNTLINTFGEKYNDALKKIITSLDKRSISADSDIIEQFLSCDDLDIFLNTVLVSCAKFPADLTKSFQRLDKLGKIDKINKYKHYEHRRFDDLVVYITEAKPDYKRFIVKIKFPSKKTIMNLVDMQKIFTHLENIKRNPSSSIELEKTDYEKLISHEYDEELLNDVIMVHNDNNVKKVYVRSDERRPECLEGYVGNT